MKTITQIKQVGKSEKYKLFLDEEFAFFVSLECIYKNALKTGQELNDDFIKQIKEESDNFFAYNLALNLMTSTLKTKTQLDQYLFKKGFDKEVRKNAIEKIERYGYVNDKEFAERYIESAKKQKGKNLIKQQLYAKGVDKKVIEESLKDLNQEDELVALAQKFLRNKEKSEETKQKLYRHLLSKGFGYGEALGAVKKFFDGDDDYDWN